MLQQLTAKDLSEGQILNILKPSGITSFQVVRQIRSATHCKKVGHGGTLDPMATGVLLVCTGKATKRFSELLLLDKEYSGVIELGKVTDTDDAEGKILHEKDVPDLTIGEINQVVSKFQGEIDQIPPLYSALKINGKRSYALARKGIDVVRNPRKVIVYQISVNKWNSPYLSIHVRCSRGTYIRALARDIGNNLNVGGYLKSLVRTRVGPYSIDQSIPLTEFTTYYNTYENC